MGVLLFGKRLALALVFPREDNLLGTLGPERGGERGVACWGGGEGREEKGSLRGWGWRRKEEDGGRKKDSKILPVVQFCSNIFLRLPSNLTYSAMRFTIPHRNIMGGMCHNCYSRGERHNESIGHGIQKGEGASVCFPFLISVQWKGEDSPCTSTAGVGKAH